MSESWHKRTDVLGIVTLGFFIILIGIIFTVTPGLFDKISDFVRDFELGDETKWYIPAPANLDDHTALYNAIFQFCLGFAIFQVFIAAARLLLKDPIDKTAGSISNMVFWFGASWVVNLLKTGTVEWFVFLGWLIMFIGVAIVIKSAIELVAHFF